MRLLEVKQPNIIVVYGGGFQPFHEGHASSYREAKAAFPGAYFFIAASNVTTERPFEFKEKQFLAQQAGVVDPFIQVGTMSYVNDNGRKVTSTPLNPLEVLKQFNPEKDVLVIIRSERDPMKTTDVSYYQPWQGIQGAEPFSKHAYVFVTKKHDFTIAGNPVYSGSQVRELYSGADDQQKTEILHDLYPQSRQLDKIKQIFDKRLAVNEGWAKNVAAGLALGAAAVGSAHAGTSVDDASWHSGKYASHVKFDQAIQKQTGSPSVNQKRISDVTGPNAAGEYRVTVTQNGKIASQFITKTPPPDWMMKEQDIDEASLATMRDYFAGDKNAQDPTTLAKQRNWFDANKDTTGRPVVQKKFRSRAEYEQWLKQNKLKQISDSEEYNLDEEAANLLEYLRKIHKRWAIVSKREGRPLVYFKGDGRPSKEWVEKQERRINHFKHKK